VSERRKQKQFREAGLDDPRKPVSGRGSRTDRASRPAHLQPQIQLADLDPVRRLEPAPPAAAAAAAAARAGGGGAGAGGGGEAVEVEGDPEGEAADLRVGRAGVLPRADYGKKRGGEGKRLGGMWGRGDGGW
jgi:hypothetical protein